MLSVDSTIYTRTLEAIQNLARITWANFVNDTKLQKLALSFKVLIPQLSCSIIVIFWSKVSLTLLKVWNYNKLIFKKEKFSKMGTQGNHLKERLTKLFDLLCSTHQSYCVDAWNTLIKTFFIFYICTPTRQFVPLKKHHPCKKLMCQFDWYWNYTYSCPEQFISK